MFYKIRCKVIACLYALFFIKDIKDIENAIPNWYIKIQSKKLNKNKDKWLNNIEDEIVYTINRVDNL